MTPTPTFRHPALAVLLALGIAAMPLSAAADGHKKRGHDDDHRRSSYAGCPPGLAKKSPACVPPGQARKAEHREERHDDRHWDRDHHRVYYIGERVDDGYHLIRDPRVYGLPYPDDGTRYVISDGQLMRVDSGTMKVLNLVRAVNAILD
jgi:Ni/Co efflux regulator RcnB